jgi:hypothetical protein
MYGTMENVRHKGYENGAELLSEVENDVNSIADPRYKALQIKAILYYYASNCSIRLITSATLYDSKDSLVMAKQHAYK